MTFGTVLCLGDSITFGARAKLGYPEWLPSLVDNQGSVEWSTLNRGISGQTTRQILDRAPGCVRELAGLPGAKWAVLLAGTNDSKRNGVTIDEWWLLYNQIVTWFRRYDLPMALCTFPKVNFLRMPSFTAESNEWLERASDHVRLIANTHGAKLIELSDIEDIDDIPDGVHLSADAYREFAIRVVTGLGLRNEI